MLRPLPALAGTARREESRLQQIVRTWSPTIAMLVALGAVLGLAVWSATNERDAAFVDFEHEQAVLATAVGADFEHRLLQHAGSKSVLDHAIVDEVVLELLGGARRLEDRGELMVLVTRPGQQGFLTTDRRIIPSSRLRAALDGAAATVVIPRDEAVGFGLPHRRAVAGLARVASRGEGPWGIVVLASADRLRSREQHEAWRLGVTVLAVAAVVTAFGAFARRRQRHELDLERRLATQALERERDALLARADKMAALAALSTGIAHEVGTPLGVIMGRVDGVLARGTADERTAQALRIVLEQVERIQRIVRGCLGLARGERPELVPTSPKTLAERAAALVRHRFDKVEVQLTTAVPADIPDVACEPQLLEQALVNVLLNACQASQRGDTVSLAVDARDDAVFFVVEDEGAGIPDDVAARATEPFFSTKRDQGGSGLGLTIAREIVSHHAGTLTLERRSGARGTRATIRLGRAGA